MPQPVHFKAVRKHGKDMSSIARGVNEGKANQAIGIFCDNLRDLAIGGGVVRMEQRKNLGARDPRGARAAEIFVERRLPLERVSILLGHTSVKITEKHLRAMGTRTTGARRGRRETNLGARFGC